MLFFYLNEGVLKDRIFMRNFFSNFIKVKTPSIVLHAPVGNISDTEFLTKRISGGLSEYMISNVNMNAYAKSMASYQNEKLLFNGQTLSRLLSYAPCVVTNSIVETQTGNVVFDPLLLLQAMHCVFPESKTILFPLNSLSPFAIDSLISIDSHADFEKYLTIYPEEQKIIEMALQLPSKIASIKNYYDS